MVRYELILHRRPKIGAKEVEKRLGDMPKELSRGTLERTLENPESGSIAIAWGSSRKRLRLIQRRIEILDGATELVDHGGAFAKALTTIGEELRYFFGAKKPEAKRRTAAPRRDPTALNYLFLMLSVVAAGFALIFARGVHDANARLYATVGAGFILGVCTSQVFVRGVRRWFAEQGRAWVSACMMLVPLVSLSGAGYEAYALGLAQQAAAKLAKQTRLAQPKPLMKPFTALLVELQRRKQREELAAALATSTETKPAAQQAAAAAITTMTSSEDPQPTASASPQPAPLRVPESIAWEPAKVAVRKSVSHRPPTLQQQLEGWEPLRTVADVNEIHVAGAVLLALLAFALGVWSGRKKRASTPVAADEPAGASQPSAAIEVSPPEPVPAAPTIAEPAPAAAPSVPPKAAAPAVEIAAAAAAVPEHSDLVVMPSPPAAVPAPLAPAEVAPLPAAVNDNAKPEPKPLAATGTDDRKPKRHREGAPGSAYKAHGSIQEEHVVPKRRDTRRDD